MMLKKQALKFKKQALKQAQPCPNCGGTKLDPVWSAIFVDGHITDWSHAIACLTCNLVQGDAPTFAEALANWNKIEGQAMRFHIIFALGLAAAPVVTPFRSAG